MSEHDEPTAPKPAFALLTVTTRPEDPENTVGLSFHTGSARGACSPEVTCHTYEEQAPILALRQGSTHVSITPAAPRNVGAADVRFAKALVDSALRYYQAMERAGRVQGRGRPPMGESASPPGGDLHGVRASRERVRALPTWP